MGHPLAVVRLGDGVEFGEREGDHGALVERLSVRVERFEPLSEAPAE